jgi:hypothetical protein
MGFEMQRKTWLGVLPCFDGQFFGRPLFNNADVVAIGEAGTTKECFTSVVAAFGNATCHSAAAAENSAARLHRRNEDPSAAPSMTMGTRH